MPSSTPLRSSSRHFHAPPVRSTPQKAWQPPTPYQLKPPEGNALNPKVEPFASATGLVVYSKGPFLEDKWAFEDNKDAAWIGEIRLRIAVNGDVATSAAQAQFEFGDHIYLAIRALCSSLSLEQLSAQSLKSINVGLAERYDLPTSNARYLRRLVKHYSLRSVRDEAKKHIEARQQTEEDSSEDDAPLLQRCELVSMNSNLSPPLITPAKRIRSRPPRITPSRGNSTSFQAILSLTKDQCPKAVLAHSVSHHAPSAQRQLDDSLRPLAPLVEDIPRRKRPPRSKRARERELIATTKSKTKRPKATVVTCEQSTPWANATTSTRKSTMDLNVSIRRRREPPVVSEPVFYDEFTDRYEMGYITAEVLKSAEAPVRASRLGSAARVFLAIDAARHLSPSVQGALEMELCYIHSLTDQLEPLIAGLRKGITTSTRMTGISGIINQYSKNLAHIVNSCLDVGLIQTPQLPNSECITDALEAKRLRDAEDASDDSSYLDM